VLNTLDLTFDEARPIAPFKLTVDVLTAVVVGLPSLEALTIENCSPAMICTIALHCVNLECLKIEDFDADSAFRTWIDMKSALEILWLRCKSSIKVDLLKAIDSQISIQKMVCPHTLNAHGCYKSCHECKAILDDMSVFSVNGALSNCGFLSVVLNEDWMARRLQMRIRCDEQKDDWAQEYATRGRAYRSLEFDRMREVGVKTYYENEDKQRIKAARVENNEFSYEYSARACRWVLKVEERTLRRSSRLRLQQN
jgi:hypothetical protein